MAENQPSRAEQIGALIQNRRSVDDAGRLQTTLEKYQVQKTEFAIGTRLFEFENRIKTEVDRIQHEADKESKRTGKKVVAENPFEDGEMTKMFSEQLKSLVTDARNMNKQMLEVQIGRMDKMMKSLSESDISQKKLLEEEYEKSLVFLKKQHELRSNLVTRSMSKVGEVAEQYLDLQSLYSGFVNHNPIMMGLFRVGSDILKNHRRKKQEQKKLEAEDAHGILMAEKLEAERKKQMLLEIARKEELDKIQRETAESENKKTKEDKKDDDKPSSGTPTRATRDEPQAVLTREIIQEQIDTQKEWLRTVTSSNPNATEEDIQTAFDRDHKIEKLKEQLTRIEAGEVILLEQPEEKTVKSENVQIESSSEKLNEQLTKVESSSEKLKDSVVKVESSSEKLKDSVVKVESSSEKLKDSVVKVEASEKLNEQLTKVESSSEKLNEQLTRVDVGTQQESHAVLTREIIQEQIDTQKEWLKEQTGQTGELLDNIIDRDYKIEKLKEQLTRIEAGEVIPLEQPPEESKENLVKVQIEQPEEKTVKGENVHPKQPTGQPKEKPKLERVEDASVSIQDDNSTRKIARDAAENAKEDRQQRLQTTDGLFERLDTIIELLKDNVENTEKPTNGEDGGLVDSIAKGFGVKKLLGSGGGLLKGGLGAAAGVLGGKKLGGLLKGAGGLLGRGGAKVAAGGLGATKGASKFAKLGGAAGKGLLKKIPGLGLLAGAGFAANRAVEGDLLGAGGELLSGLVSIVPGIGTAASLAIDGALAARDMSREGKFTKEAGDGALLSQISKGEGTDDKTAKKKNFKSGYDVPVGYTQFVPDGFDKPLSEMTIGEVKKYQKGMLKNGAPSTAVGKYQIIKGTLEGLQKTLDIPDSEVFSPEIQDRMAMALMDQRGLQKVKSGEMSPEQFQDNLSKEWASVANSQTGQSYYGQHTGTSSTEIQGAIQIAASKPNLEAIPPKASVDRVNTIESNVEEINYHKQQMALEAAQPVAVPIPTGGEKSGNRNGGKSSVGGVMPLGSARNPDSSVQRVTDRYITFGSV